MQADAYNYMSDARDRDSEVSSDHMSKKQYIDDSDGSDVKEQLKTERMEKKFEERQKVGGIALKEEKSDVELHKQNAEVIMDASLKPAVTPTRLTSKSFLEDQDSKAASFRSTLQQTHGKQAEKTNSSSFERRDFHIQDPAQAAYNKSLRQNGLQNRQQLQLLHN